MDTQGIDVVTSAVEPLCGPLHDIFAVATARSQAIRASLDLGDGVYNSMGADVTRALVHKAIGAHGGIGAWQLAGNHNLRGQVLLRSRLMRIRFLHERAGSIPAPGHNVARRAYYRNVTLGQQKLLDAESSNLIAVWSVTDPEVARVSIRIVRPISDDARWTGAQTEVDLDFILPNLSEDLEGLEFIPTDTGLFLDLPEAEDDDQSGQASTGDVR